MQSITTRKGLIDTVGNTTLQQVFVYDSNSGTVKVRCIETGIQNMTTIEVIKGLDTSCRIVTAPYTAINRDLSDGSQVTETK